MLHIDRFTRDDYARLAAQRGEAASIYMPTTPISRHVNENRIRFKTLAKNAVAAAEKAQFSTAHALSEAFARLEGDYQFWSNQAHGLAVHAIDGVVTAVRLGYTVSESAEISSRAHLKPMLPALHPKLLWVLMISDDGAELYQLLDNRTLSKVDTPDMPNSLRDEMGELIERRRGEANRLTSGEGYLVRQREYLKAVHDAIEPIIRGSDFPLVLVTTVEHFGEYKRLNSYPRLAGHIALSPKDTPHDVILDELDGIERAERQQRVRRWEALYAERQNDRRTVSEVQQISRLLSAGQIESLVVAQDELKYGVVDKDGVIEFGAERGPASYDVYDDIVRRALDTGVEILPLRSDEKVDASLFPIAATLRWPQ